MDWNGTEKTLDVGWWSSLWVQIIHFLLLSTLLIIIISNCLKWILICSRQSSNVPRGLLTTWLGTVGSLLWMHKHELTNRGLARLQKLRYPSSHQVDDGTLYSSLFLHPTPPSPVLQCVRDRLNDRNFLHDLYYTDPSILCAGKTHPEWRTNFFFYVFLVNRLLRSLSTSHGMTEGLLL